MRENRLRLLVILTLAFALRLVSLPARPLWYDEAFAVLYAEKSFGAMVYGTVTPVEGASAADVHPLLYYFGLHLWIALCGQSPLAVRLPSVLLGVATVGLVGAIGSRVFDRRVGWVAALVAALAPFPVAYAQEARMYALLGFAAIAAAYTLLRALSRLSSAPPVGAPPSGGGGGGGWWALYAVAAALTLYAHNLGAFTLLALNLLVVRLVVARRRWRALLPLALANLGALLLFAPWLVLVLPGQIGFVQHGYWVEQPRIGSLVNTLVTFHFNLPLPRWLLPLALGVALLLLTLAGYRAWRERSRAGWFLFLGWVPVALLFLVSQFHPVYIERALLPAALLYHVAVGWLLVGGAMPRPIVLGLVTVALIVTGLALGYHYTYAGFPRPPFDQVAAHLRAHMEPGDAVVHSNKLTFFPVHYYDRELPGAWVDDPDWSGSRTLAQPTQEALGLFASPTITDAVGSAATVWFVLFPREVDEYRALGFREHPSLEWLIERYRQTDVVRFNDLDVYHFEWEGP